MQRMANKSHGDLNLNALHIVTSGILTYKQCKISILGKTLFASKKKLKITPCFRVTVSEQKSLFSC